jgi:hypothetical protein
VVASFRGQGKGLADGVTVRFGWSVLTLRQQGGQLVVHEPDFGGDPLRGVREDVTCTLRVLVGPAAVLNRLGVEPTEVRFDDRVVVARDCLEDRRVYLQRSEPKPGDSGWYVGPLDSPAPEPKPENFESLYDYELFRQRPALSRVLGLPPGLPRGLRHGPPRCRAHPRQQRRLGHRTVTRLYDYVGPADIRARAAGRPTGTRIDTLADLVAWLRQRGPRPNPEGLTAATLVIDSGGRLLLADRRSEHVACAGGGPVRSAGELFLRVEGDEAAVAEASNQSTGYCPELESWPAVAAALDRVGVPHPGRFTTAVVFGRCERCGKRNVVEDGWFVCGVCGAGLPERWNL